MTAPHDNDATRPADAEGAPDHDETSQAAGARDIAFGLGLELEETTGLHEDHNRDGQ